MRRGRLAGAVALAAALGVVVAGLIGCSGRSGGSAGSSVSSALGPGFAIDQDFADPSVLVDGGTAYAFATNTPGFTVRAATSRDLKTWKVGDTDALPELPGWAVAGRTWAPEVARMGAGRYIMYVTATDARSGRQCIGTASSATPAGPFAPVGSEPLVCPRSEGGAIDASTFRDDDGRFYLLWKTDGNCCGLDTWIELAPLSADGLALAGPSKRLLKQSEPWQGALVEAPDLVKRGRRYVLFYSANDYSTDAYAVGVAESPALIGPYTASGSPFLSTASGAGRYLGPGGEDVVTFGGRDWLVFHSWDDSYAYRGMVVRPLGWTGAIPTLG
ncbi:glycoside hydrolase family 43 protein [Leifsonia sp. NPDC058248]|uniref:glycoside hydrolase family 43 protein n=1 Tax=Leifsonia sp. NPDC058248 TaxID=3346402 RepID=UPI0036DED858